MNQALVVKIQGVITEAKKLASEHSFADVYMNNDEHNYKEVWDEYAKQINYTNKFRQMKKDLNFILSLLTEAKGSVSPNTPSGKKVLDQVTAYMETIKSLLKTYTEIDNGQWWILNYYDKGGGQQR